MPKPNQYTFSQGLADFIAELRLGSDKSPSTIENYYRDLLLFYRYLAGNDEAALLTSRKPELIAAQQELDAALPPIAVTDITHRDIKAFLLHCQDVRQNSKFALARKVSALKAFFAFLMQEEIIAVDPMEKVARPKVNPRDTLRKHLNRDDIDALFSHIQDQEQMSHRNMAIISLLLYGGLRISELINLKVTDIRFGENYIQVLHGKGNKQRLVPLPDKVMACLRSYLQHRSHPDAVYLFTNRQGGKLSRSSAYYIVKQLIREVGLDSALSPHNTPVLLYY